MQGFSEVFGNLISIPFVKYIGVKKTGILFNAVAGLSMILTIIMLEVDPKRYSLNYQKLQGVRIVRRTFSSRFRIVSASLYKFKLTFQL